MTGIIMFAIALLLVLLGYPVAFTFGGIALIVGVISQGWDIFAFMPYRIQSIMENTVLMAVPLFIFMGIILEKTKLAEQLLESMGYLFGNLRGGLAVSTILVGALLATSTGVVGASVVAMGVISLPVMIKHGYNIPMSCGVICGAGTLGQIIPPSIILIILGEVLGVPVGDLFQAALIPGLLLVLIYSLYIVGYSHIFKDCAPAISTEHLQSSRKKQYFDALVAVLPPLALMIVVLGSIFSGIATPTESSALGVIGAILLAIVYGKFSIAVLFDSAKQTAKITAMVFAILLGATAFSMVFSYTGGDRVTEHFLTQLPGEKWGFLLFSMAFILVLGFFIDFVEISFIVVPILSPIAETLGINMLWFAILIAMNLQTSFLTPPFGFSLFYLKGVAPPQVTTLAIYKGVIPFITIQVLVLLSLLVFPKLYGLS